MLWHNVKYSFDGGWSEGPNAKTNLFNSFDVLANCYDKGPGQNLEIHFYHFDVVFQRSGI